MKNWSRRHLPSLNSFATFEIAAKHLSFTIAATELNVTQAAVSQQIKYLEKATGKQLFLRKHNALELTPEGRRLLAAITRGLDSISQAVAELTGSTEANTITCSATMAVASHWLKPLIDQFSADHPDIRFVILASDEDDALRNFEEVDVAFICGNERCEVGEELHFLFPEVVKPVCSPAFLEINGPLNTLEELANARLMHLHQKHWNSAAIGWQPITWQHWFTATGYDVEHNLPGLVSNNYELLINAAIQDQGFILGWQHIIGNELKAGRLVIAHPTPLRLERGNFLKVNGHSKDNPTVALFVKFVLGKYRHWKAWD